MLNTLLFNTFFDIVNELTIWVDCSPQYTNIGNGFVV